MRINEVKLKIWWKTSVLNQIEKAYKNFPYYNKRIFFVRTIIQNSDAMYLSEIWKDIILQFSYRLWKVTIVSTLWENLTKWTSWIIELLWFYEWFYYQRMKYLSWMWWKDYLDEKEFDWALLYNDFESLFSVSILTPYFQLKE